MTWAALRGASVGRYRIPRGNRGIRRTVREMRQLANEALTDPLLVETAAIISEGTGVPDEQATRLRLWLADTTDFQPDPVGHELIRSPGYMLDRIYSQGWAAGDCDDVATLAAALGKAMGLPARYRLLSFMPGAPFSHVVTDVRAGCCWLDLDTTAPDQFPPGLEIHASETHEV